MTSNDANRLTRLSVVGATLALFILIGLGAFLVRLYVGGERERDLLQWESRLGMVADTKVDALERLLDEDLRNLRELAGNASLQLYLSRLAQSPAAAGSADQPPELGWLRNLVWASADRYGFVPADEPRIPANVGRSRTSGLVLLDAQLNPVVTTPGLVDLRATFSELAQKALRQPKVPAVDLLPDARNNVVLVFALAVEPVLGATASGAAQPPAGVLIGVRSADQALFPLLLRGPSFAEDSETLLLMQRAGRVVYLSPTADGTGAMRRSLPVGTPRLAEAAAVTVPERFVSLDSYRGKPVLQISRPVRGQPWVLALQVDAVQALSESNQRQAFLLTVLSLLLFLIAAVSVAAWRHGSSVRARHRAEEFEQQAAKLQRQTELLHTVTDNVDVLTLLVTRDDRVLFTNEAAAAALGGAIADVLGRHVGVIAGPAAGAELARGLGEARVKREAVHRLLDLELPGKSASYQAGFLPVARIGDAQDLVLIVLSDVTEVRRRDQKHAELLRRLVTSLVSAVDLRDPYSSSHATRMAEVANAVAAELQLEPGERETLDLAATLANVGKVMIPSELLTKKGPLTPDEEKLLHRHVDYTLDLLKGLDFEGPVLDVIAQKQEHLDGTGYPKGLTEQQLSTAGKILAVANAFVALVSIRAYRQGMSVRDALDELMRTADARYDRRVLAALFHVVENRKDWSDWK